jgi:signal peptidase I
VTRARNIKMPPRWSLGLLVVPVAALLCALLLAEPMRVSSGSMSPSYDRGDEVLVAKLGFRAHGPRRGDVIVIHAPPGGELMIKRVAAVGGDDIGIADGVLIVNRRRVEEPYVDQARVDGTYFGPVRVPPKSVWVLGDARAGSVDSRTFGAVPLDAVVGRVLVQLW